jgi:DNA polymerase
MVHPTPTSRTSRSKRPVSARARTIDTPTAQHAPASSIDALRKQAANCRACPLYKNATQTVFGEGRQSASIVLVGEQPGDREDIAGQPFVGPAGRLLDRALELAGVDRRATYVTNAVKHFKFEPRGKRRIHKKPNELEIAACHPWLEQELQLIEPRLVIALGATAARAVFGRATAIGKNRGRILEHAMPSGADVLVTVHPSFLLRVPDSDRDDVFAQFVDDLKLARRYATTASRAMPTI